MDPVTGTVAGALTIAGLKYVGKPTADAAKELVVKMLGGSADAVGEHLAETTREWLRRRQERGHEVLTTAAAMLEEAGLEAQPVPGRILFPILEHSSLEEDDDLRRKWAALLANAASERRDMMLPAFAEILRQLMPVQAHVLDWLSEQVFTTEDKFGPAQQLDATAVTSELLARFGLTSHEWEVLAGDFSRLNLIAPAESSRHTGRQALGDSFVNTFESIVLSTLTPLGYHFLRACRPPGPRETRT